jgi:hypothetical protein
MTTDKNTDLTEDVTSMLPDENIAETAEVAAKPAKKQVSPEKKAKRQEAIKKVSAQVMNVAKATLEAKGIKFPSKEQVEKQAEEIAPTEKKKGFMVPLLIGGGAIALILLLKKK